MSTLKICQNCGEKCEELHKHHIVPRARGGTDASSNLIKLCITCHGKAHDVSFKSNTGVVSSGISKAKSASKLASLWAENSGIDRLMNNLFNEDEELYNFLSSGMMLGIISKDFLFQIIRPEFATKRSGLINIKKCNAEKIRECYDSI